MPLPEVVKSIISLSDKSPSKRIIIYTAVGLLVLGLVSHGLWEQHLKDVEKKESLLKEDVKYFRTKCDTLDSQKDRAQKLAIKMALDFTKSKKEEIEKTKKTEQ